MREGFPSTVSPGPGVGVGGLRRPYTCGPSCRERQSEGFICPTRAGKALRQGDSGSELQRWAGYAMCRGGEGRMAFQAESKDVEEEWEKDPSIMPSSRPFLQ